MRQATILLKKNLQRSAVTKQLFFRILRNEEK